VPGAILFLGERLTAQRALGLVIGIAGLVALFNPLALDWSDAEIVKGNAILLGAALCWAIGIVAVKRHAWRCSPLDAMPWQLLLAALPALLLALISDSGKEIIINLPSAMILLYNGPIATALAVWAALSINRALPAVTTSLGMLGVPAGGVFFSALILGEQLTVSLVLGLFLIAGSVAIVAWADWRGSARTQVTA